MADISKIQLPNDSTIYNIKDAGAPTLLYSNAIKVGYQDDYDSATYLTPGNYYCYASSTAASLSHCPTTYAHRLFVLSQNMEERLVQIIITNNSTVSIYKRYYAGTWGAWNKVVDTSIVPDPPATSGTYFLQCTVSSGSASYSWVSTPAAEGVSF